METDPRRELATRWLDLCGRLGVDAGAAASWWDRIDEAHGEAHRAYHHLGHLAECFDLVDRFDDLGPAERDVVEVAIWFHDIVYDAEATDNEARSAVVADEFLGRSGLGTMRAEVADLIAMTAGHRSWPSSPTVDAMHDADLAILGSAPARYAEYAAAIRSEYRHVDDEAFRQGRAAVLRGFLDQPELFRRRDVRDARETRARANLARELAALSHGG